MAGFKTPLQERAERDIFSKDKEVAKKAMDILLGEADRLFEAHNAILPYQLLMASPAMIGDEIKYSNDTENKDREAYRMRCRHYGAEGGCRKQSHAERIYGYYFAVDIACTPDCGCARMKRYDKLNKQ